MEVTRFIGFPQKITLEEVRECIKERKEFRECRFEGYSIFSYFYTKTDTFPDPTSTDDQSQSRAYALRRECRGLVFGDNGKILSRRYHKFFNINERPETKSHMIDFTRDYVFLEKMDGSMSGNDAETYAKSMYPYIDYFGFCMEWLQKNYSPIFEWCSVAVPVVLKYEKDQLILTSLRDNDSGLYMNYDQMVENAQKYHVPVVQAFRQKESVQSLADILEEIKNNKQLEGCVLRFADGEMFKIKTEWYHSLGSDLHRYTKTRHNNEKFMWRQILENKYDDMRAYIPEDKLEWIDQFADQLQTNIDNLANRITEDVVEINGTLCDPSDKKAFAEALKEKEKIYHPIYWDVRNGFDGRESIVKAILRNLNQHFEVSTHLANNIKWNQYKK